MTTRTSRLAPTVQTEQPEPTTISSPSDVLAAPAPGRGRGSASAGFTLIEILIVLAIIAAVMALGLPAISRITYQKINSTTRKFVGLVRTVRNDSILLTNIHRIAFDLDKKTYWVEQQRELKSLDPPVTDRKRLSKNDEPPPSNFIYAEKYSSKPIPMPSGVAFTGVLKEEEGMIKQGVVYVHFFPNGFNEQAILYIAREGDQPGKGYSIVIRGTSGRVEISPNFIQTLDTPL